MTRRVYSCGVPTHCRKPPSVSRKRWLLVLFLAAGLGSALLLVSGVAPPETSRTLSSGVLDFFAADAAHDALERLAVEERFAEAFDRAVATLDERVARFGGEDPRTLASLQWAAAIAQSGGDRRTAQELFEALLALRRRALDGGDPHLAEAWLRLGRAARLQDNFPLAGRCFTEARRIVRRAGSPRGLAPLAAAIEQGEAGMRLRLDLPGAEAGFRRALGIRRGLDPVPALQVSESLVWLGWTLDRLGRPEQAASYLDEARWNLAGLDAAGGTLAATGTALRADALLAAGRLEEAEALYREEAAARKRARSFHAGGFARRVCPLDGYEPLALLALKRGDERGAWTLLQEGRAATTRDLIALGRAARRQDRLAGLDAALLRAVRERERLMRGGDHAWSPGVRAATLAMLRLRARLGLLESRLLREADEPVLSIEATQALLRPGDALLGWLEVDVGGSPSGVSMPRRSWGYVYVLRHHGPIRWIPLWNGSRPPAYETARADWGPVFQRLKRAAEWPLRVDSDPEVLRQLRAWTERHFDPALPLLDGVDRILVEGIGLPLEALRDADGRFLVDRFDFVYVPSAAVLGLLARPQRPAPATGSILAVAASGDAMGFPAGDDALVRLALAERHREVRWLRTSFSRADVPLDRLPHLRFAGLESGAVARRFRRATVIQGGDDVEGRLGAFVRQGGLERVDVVHVATHTLLDPAPERSGVALAERPPAAGRIDDGVLDAEEVLRGWSLHGALFTLSACESARSSGMSRGEDLGLTPALFAAGARTILVSLWTVDDRATAILMDRFYRGLTSGRSAPKALAEAKRFLRDLPDEDGKRPFEHPAYWSGFVLMGAP